MDGNNDQNRSMDGMRPADQAAPRPTVDGFAPTTIAPQPINDVMQAPAPTVIDPAPQVVPPKKQKKGISVWVVILIVLLFAGLAAGGVYYWQNKQATADAKAAATQYAALQQQLTTQQQSTAQAQIDALTKSNTDLTAQVAAQKKTIDTQTAYIKTLAETATKLKTTCGTACSAITIPPAPTTTP